MKFYKETNFKETPIGKIPKEWGLAKLEKIVEKIKAGGTPLTTIKQYWNGDIPFVKIEDISSSSRYLDKTNSSISAKGLENSSAWIVPESSLLLAMYGSLGELAINKIPVATNQAILGIIPKDKHETEFLYYWFLYFKPNWRRYAKPTTQANLTAHIVRNTLVPLPSSKEQRGIVNVLSCIDLAIEKVDEAIARAERLKKGLMQQLLTKGIGHKEFKETPIGKIPKTWKVVKLKEAVIEVKPGFACGKRDDKGILQLRMDNIETDGWINPNAGVRVPIPENVDEYLLKPGDILFNNTNSVDLIGKTAIFRGEFPRCVYSNHLTRIRVNRSKLIPEWIMYLFIRYWRQGVFRALCHQHVHQAGINKSNLLNLKIYIAPLEEQMRIVEVLSSIEHIIRLKKKKKKKLVKMKRRLMNLLLTGKVRVSL